MSVGQKDDGRFYWVCDSCGRPSTRIATDRNLLAAQLRDAGWRIYREGGAWRHSCPRCVRDWAANTKRML